MGTFQNVTSATHPFVATEQGVVTTRCRESDRTAQQGSDSKRRFAVSRMPGSAPQLYQNDRPHQTGPEPVGHPLASIGVDATADRDDPTSPRHVQDLRHSRHTHMQVTLGAVEVADNTRDAAGGE